MEKSSQGIVVPIALSLVGVVAMSSTAWLLQYETLPTLEISQHPMVNFTFTMQMIVLAISFVALLLMYLYNRVGFKTFFRSGITFSGEKNDWNTYGPVAAIGFTMGTTILMSFSVAGQQGVMNETFFSLIPLVLLFSATNAWTEEIFTRFVIVAGLDGKLKPDTICWISAGIFGVPHFFGTPSGVFGVIMSGFLGWILAKSVIETRGMGWALLIHFFQDVAIFGAGAMIVAK